METKLVRIAEISATSKHPIFTSVYHLINEDMLKQCHKELDGNKAVGIDKVTKDEYGKNLDRNIKELVQRLKNKSFKPLPSLRVYIPKGNGKKRPLGIASYEDKIVQMAVKKILGAIYEPRFLNCMYGFRPNRGCHEAIKEVYQRISYGKISYIVDADIKGFFDHIDHDWMMKFLEWNIQDRNLLWLIRKYLKAGIMEQGKFEPTEEGSAQGSVMSPMLANIYMHHAYLRGEEERREYLSGNIDINYFDYDDTHAKYSVGEIGNGMKYTIERASVVREIQAVEGSKLIFKKVLPLMGVEFVRYGMLTVVPFPFKYLREYIVKEEKSV